MEDMDHKLLAEARERRDKALRDACEADLIAEAAHDEFNRLDASVNTLEALMKEQSEFTESARKILK